MNNNFGGYYCPYCMIEAMYSPEFLQPSIELRDYGPNPFVVDIENVAEYNTNFITALWTGENLQLTLMSLNIGEEIGLEVHPDSDQFIKVEEGHAFVMIGDTRDNLNFRRSVDDDDAIIIPAGKWHNIINTGHKPLKIYSIYAPPEHPKGTIHRTKADAHH